MSVCCWARAPYLRHVFDQSNSQFNVGAVVEEVQPGDLLGCCEKQSDQSKGPAHQQQGHGCPGDPLASSLIPHPREETKESSSEHR